MTSFTTCPTSESEGGCGFSLFYSHHSVMSVCLCSEKRDSNSTWCSSLGGQRTLLVLYELPLSCVCVLFFFFLSENLWLVIQKVNRCLFSFSYDTPHCLCSRKHDIAVIARNELFASGLHSKLASEGRNSWQLSSNCIVLSLAVSLDNFFSRFANPNRR